LGARIEMNPTAEASELTVDIAHNDGNGGDHHQNEDDDNQCCSAQKVISPVFRGHPGQPQIHGPEEGIL